MNLEKRIYVFVSFCYTVSIFLRLQIYSIQSGTLLGATTFDQSMNFRDLSKKLQLKSNNLHLIPATIFGMHSE